ncbi:MAG TPA: hypothetical protein VGG01_21250 [Xanthobacteraceae bacterium]
MFASMIALQPAMTLSGAVPMQSSHASARAAVAWSPMAAATMTVRLSALAATRCHGDNDCKMSERLTTDSLSNPSPMRTLPVARAVVEGCAGS